MAYGRHLAHLGEDGFRLELLNRPFRTAKDHDETIIANWNSVVKPGDTVYHLGDFAFNDDLVAEYAERLNGTIHLFLGNHDTLPPEVLERHFASVKESMGFAFDCTPPMAKESKHYELHLQHYPGRSIPEKFNIVGHIHSAWKVQKNMLNVGIDVNHLRPMPLEKVAFYINAVTNFYDGDVWVGGHPANVAHDDRGKTTHYYDEE